MNPARSSRRAIRIVSQCATAEEFVAAFHPYLDRDSLFIATGSPEEPGQAVRFIMTLAGGEMMLHGAGRVVESHRDRGNFYGLRGMKLQFDELDDGSRRVLAALETRAGGHGPRPAPASAAAAADVIECLIYDDPGNEPAEPAAMAGPRRRSTRLPAQTGLPPGDDDVTAVSPAPRPPAALPGRGREPPPPPRSHRASGAVPIQLPPHQHNTPAPPRPPMAIGRDGAMPFMVPRPRSDEGGFPEPGHASPGPDGIGHGGPERPAPREVTGREAMLHRERDTGSHGSIARSSAQGNVASGSVEIAEMPTDVLPSVSVRPRGSPPPPVPPVPEQAALAQSGPVPLPAMAGSGPHRDYEVPGFALGEFTMPPTRPGGRRGVPRPPLPAEKTQVVRFRRPSYVRTAAVSATLGALLGLGAGYLLWGLDQVALRGGIQPRAADPIGAKSEVAKPDVPSKPGVARPDVATIDDTKIGEKPAPVGTSPEAAADPDDDDTKAPPAAASPADAAAVEKPVPVRPSRRRR